AGPSPVGEVRVRADRHRRRRGRIRRYEGRLCPAIGGDVVSEVYTSAGYTGGLRIEKVVTSGIFALDGGEWEVDNNIWILGDDSEVFVIDAAHTAQPIIDAVAGRK